MKNRIIGIDVARALAIMGMILVNFKMIFGQDGNYWLQSIVSIFEGKAAALFVILAGIGIAFMTNKAINTNDEIKLRLARIKIIKRARLLFILGLSFIIIWPADILHFYGIYMLFTLLFLKGKTHQIILGILGFLLCYPVLMFFIEYDTGWNFKDYSYTDFWTINGFIRNLFYNGFHPVIPWTSFMLLGLWFGRQDLNNEKFIKKTFFVSILIVIGMQLFSKILISILSGGNETIVTELAPVLGTSPMPPLPIYMVSSSSVALCVICSCIWFAKRMQRGLVIKVLQSTGQLALTFYVAHVIIGIGAVELISTTELGMFSIEFSFIYAIIFSILCMVFAIIWTRYNKQGPLEWVLRKLTS
ncbi:DUF418 domain-containing protein [uncultured Kordia sp.]|uniref:DUF418 domain-containing protein n=1 Tax=uncultured Kordia sp. TaxID=507699 RepID=UPI0026329A94|nr:DUF418 domain-containing protein [uncultured Kordia sp.]